MHAFRWGWSYKRLQLAQLLGQLDIVLAHVAVALSKFGGEPGWKSLPAPVTFYTEKGARLSLVHPLLHTNIDWH